MGLEEARHMRCARAVPDVAGNAVNDLRPNSCLRAIEIYGPRAFPIENPLSRVRLSRMALSSTLPWYSPKEKH